MSNFNQDHFFNKKEKLYFIVCGLLIAFSIIWVVNVYMEYRVVQLSWEEKGFHEMSPSQFWDIPTANFKPIINKLSG